MERSRSDFMEKAPSSLCPWLLFSWYIDRLITGFYRFRTPFSKADMDPEEQATSGSDMVSITLRLSGNFCEIFARPGDARRPFFRRFKFRIIFFSLCTLCSRSSSPTSAEAPRDRTSPSSETSPAQSKPQHCRAWPAEATAIRLPPRSDRDFLTKQLVVSSRNTFHQ